MNKNLIAYLNSPLLASEYAAVLQYEHHAAVAENYGLDAFAAYIRGRAAQEREHIHELQKRILDMGGIPLTAPSAVHAVEPIEEALSADESSESTAVADYSRGIAMAVESGDEVTAELLRHIVVEEDAHLVGIRDVKSRIELAGFGNWVATVIGG